jgi:hypothetical protein
VWSVVTAIKVKRPWSSVGWRFRRGSEGRGECASAHSMARPWRGEGRVRGASAAGEKRRDNGGDRGVGRLGMTLTVGPTCRRPCERVEGEMERAAGDKWAAGAGWAERASWAGGE